MKRIIINILLLMSAVSCVTETEIKHDGPENMLSVNASLTEGDPVHYVYVTMSHFTGMTAVSRAELEFRVNGELAAETDSLINEGIFPDYLRALAFKADFHPGDRLWLRVTADGETAEAEVVVPKAPDLRQIDTSTITLYDDKEGMMVKKLLFKMRVKDIPDELNNYRLSARLDYSFVVDSLDLTTYEEEVHGEMHEGDILRTGNESIEIDNSLEPLLNNGVNMGLSGYVSDYQVNYYDNAYNIFTDNSFKDGEYTLGLVLPSVRRLRAIFYGVIWYYYTIGQTRRFSIRLHNMDRDTYSYYNAINFDASSQSSTYFTSQPIYPSNVRNGIGFVNAQSTAERVYELPYIKNILY